MKDYAVTIDLRLRGYYPDGIVVSIMNELDDGESISNTEYDFVQIDSENRFHFAINADIRSTSHPARWLQDMINEYLQEDEEVEVNIRYSEQTL